MCEAEICADLEGLAELQADSILVRDLPEPTDAHWRPAQPDRESLAAAVFARRIDDRWRVSSYSALVRGDDGEQPDYDPSDPQRIATPPLDEGQPAGELAVPVLADPGGDALFDLPAGSRAGQFLHEIFEQIDFTEDDDEGLNAVVAAQLARYGGLSNTDDPEHDWSATVVALVTGVLDTPLDSTDGLRLRDIPLVDRLTELEFHFPVADLDPGRLRRALSASPDYVDSVRGLGFAPLRGLMRGFIDLVFRYQGCYYIVDYKSNRLGRELAAYDHAGMGRAIREHRYDLQYLSYRLALHRFLGRRLADYDYRRDFGGGYSLFLRGMRPAQGPAYGVWHDQPPLHTIEALDELFRGDKPGEGA
jgi:exodeoxyribonuclease V beta subunit